MVKCDRRNCRLNDESICEDGIIRDGFCVSEDIDNNKCEYCGAELIKVKGENLEHFGFLCNETFLRCPNNCD